MLIPLTDRFHEQCGHTQIMIGTHKQIKMDEQRLVIEGCMCPRALVEGLISPFCAAKGYTGGEAGLLFVTPLSGLDCTYLLNLDDLHFARARIVCRCI